MSGEAWYGERVMTITEARLTKIESAYERVDASLSDSMVPVGRGDARVGTLRAEMNSTFDSMRASIRLSTEHGAVITWASAMVSGVMALSALA